VPDYLTRLKNNSSRDLQEFRLNRKIRFLKKIDSLIGPVSVRVVNALLKPQKRLSGKITSILVIRPGGIGDAVLLLPAMKALKGAYPDAVINVLCEKRNAGIFHLCAEADKISLYDRPSELLSAIAGSYDMVIDTEQWYRLSAVIAYLTRAPLRIGFATNEREVLFSRPVNYFQDKYEMESFLDLLGDLPEKKNLKEESFLTLPDKEAGEAEMILGPFSAGKIVALFPGGSIEEKKWPLQKFHHLSRLLVEQGYALVAVGGKSDYRDCCHVADGIEECINLCGQLTLAGTAAILKRASLLITGDSGIMHIACALGTSTLALFGPGNEKKWSPRGGAHAVIRKSIDCSPCSRFGDTPACKKNRECMNLIGVEEVFIKTVELLER